MKECVAHSIGKEQSKGLLVSTFHTLGFDIILSVNIKRWALNQI